MIDKQAQDINSFWLTEVGPAGWYEVDEAVDQAIRDRYRDLWVTAKDGALDEWMLRPESALALMILLDQFPRNMFRNCKNAFSSDCKALAKAKQAIAAGHDLCVDEPERQFFYLPLMHSESLSDQERCVRLIMTRMPQTGAGNLPHAKAHRDLIRRFGRFPYRNQALGRTSTGPEQEFLEEAGYAA